MLTEKYPFYCQAVDDQLPALEDLQPNWLNETIISCLIRKCLDDDMRKTSLSVWLSGSEVLPEHLRADCLHCGVLGLVPAPQAGGAGTEAGAGAHRLVPPVPPQLTWKQEKMIPSFAFHFTPIRKECFSNSLLVKVQIMWGFRVFFVFLPFINLLAIGVLSLSPQLFPSPHWKSPANIFRFNEDPHYYLNFNLLGFFKISSHLFLLSCSMHFNSPKNIKILFGGKVEQWWKAKLSTLTPVLVCHQDTAHGSQSPYAPLLMTWRHREMLEKLSYKGHIRLLCYLEL